MAKRKTSWQKAQSFADKNTPGLSHLGRAGWESLRDHVRFGYQNGYLAGVAFERRRKGKGASGGE